MILYILLFIIFFILLFFIYIRLKYRFWALQPVFHYYDIYYWLFNVGIINHELPQKNRYTNFINIKTFNIDELTNKQIQDFILLVQLNYFINKDNKFYPKTENIIPYFKAHNNNCFISLFNKPNFLYDTKNNDIIEDTKLIGVITSRPLLVSIIRSKIINKFSVYYVDYLCVDKYSRKQNIAPQLIQTHEYNQRHYNKNIVVSLFKREDELTGIIPLTIYKTYCFNMKNWKKPPSLSSNIKILTGDNQNIYYLYNFLNENIYNWSVIIIPEMSNLLELIKTNNIYVKMLVYNNEIEAFYIFKKTCTFIEKDKEIISCICSMNGNKLTKKQFIHGFKVSLWSLLYKETNKYFNYLTIENISDNHYIINNIKLKTIPVVVSPTAYFFYNFAYEPFDSTKVLIIN